MQGVFISRQALYTLLLLVLTLITWPAAAFDSGKLSFSVKVGRLDIPYQEFALFVMPGEKTRLTSNAPFKLLTKHGGQNKIEQGYLWTAPQKTGYYKLSLHSQSETMHLNVFVMRPASDISNGKLGSYQIGKYSKKPFRKLPVYESPKGFVEVLPEYTQIKVSPHFKLGWFLSKQHSGWPKYMLLRPELTIKLEQLLEYVNLSGIDTDAFVIMSGFRTPWYNQSIGNRTTSSRHLYGGAADIYIDVNPRDGVMDDLNKDGKLNKADAVYLFNLFEKWSHLSKRKRLTGGLGAYGSTSSHGPFVHVDSRGYKARWGHK